MSDQPQVDPESPENALRNSMLNWIAHHWGWLLLFIFVEGFVAEIGAHLAPGLIKEMVVAAGVGMQAVQFFVTRSPSPSKRLDER